MPITSHPMFHDPAYPSSEHLSPPQIDGVTAFNRRIADGTHSFVEQPCLCASTDAVAVATYDRYRVWQPVVLCRKCGLMSCRPRMSDETIAWFYSSDFYRELYNDGILPHTQDKFLAIAHRGARSRDTIRERCDYAAVQSVAEIGCGAGWNLYAYHQDGRRVKGTDYSPALTEAGRAMGLDIGTRPLKPETDGHFDLVILSHVVEHVPDPATMIREARDLMAPDGLLYIEVPDGRTICQGLFQNAHLWYFAPEHLLKIAAKQGLAPRYVGARDIETFFMILSRSDAPPFPDESRVYQDMYSRIVAHDRRLKLKDALQGAGVLGLARKLKRIIGR